MLSHVHLSSTSHHYCQVGDGIITAIHALSTVWLISFIFYEVNKFFLGHIHMNSST